MKTESPGRLGPSEVRELSYLWMQLESDLGVQALQPRTESFLAKAVPWHERYRYSAIPKASSSYPAADNGYLPPYMHAGSDTRVADLMATARVAYRKLAWMGTNGHSLSVTVLHRVYGMPPKNSRYEYFGDVASIVEYTTAIERVRQGMIAKLVAERRARSEARRGSLSDAAMSRVYASIATGAEREVTTGDVVREMLMPDVDGALKKRFVREAKTDAEALLLRACDTYRLAAREISLQ